MGEEDPPFKRFISEISRDQGWKRRGGGVGYISEKGGRVGYINEKERKERKKRKERKIKEDKE